MKRILVACVAAGLFTTACGTNETGQATDVAETSAVPATTASEDQARERIVASSELAALPGLREMCQGFVEYLELMSQFDEGSDVGDSVDTNRLLDEVLAESKASSEWATTPRDEQVRMEAAIEQAKSGRC